MIIIYLLTFIITWILSWYTHELFHGYKHLLLGGSGYSIQLSDNKLGLVIYYYGSNTDQRNVDLAGGLYTSILLGGVLLLLAVFNLLGYNPWTYSVILCGIIQWTYGYYEWSYIRQVDSQQYTVGRYLLYFVVIAVFSVVWVMI